MKLTCENVQKVGGDVSFTLGKVNDTSCSCVKFCPVATDRGSGFNQLINFVHLLILYFTCGCCLQFR